MTIELDCESLEKLAVTRALAEGSVMWWIGDWLRFGERKYGQMYEQALEATDRSYKTLRNAAYVGNQIELSRRRDNLSWGHHAEVAALDPGQQDYWLDLAETEDLSVMKLRAAIHHAKILFQIKWSKETL